MLRNRNILYAAQNVLIASSIFWPTNEISPPRIAHSVRKFLVELSSSTYQHITFGKISPAQLQVGWDGIEIGMRLGEDCDWDRLG